MELGHGVGAKSNRPHEVDLKSSNLKPQLRPQLPNPEILNLKLRLLVAGVEARVVPQVGVELGNFEAP
jgi:hypothetical protein